MTEPVGAVMTVMVVALLVLISLAFVLSFAAFIGIILGLISKYTDNPHFDPQQGVYQLTSDATFYVVIVVLAVVLLYGFFLPIVVQGERRRRRATSHGNSDIHFKEISSIILIGLAIVVGGQWMPHLFWSLAGPSTSRQQRLPVVLSFLGAGAAGLSALGPALIALSRSRKLQLPKQLVKKSTKMANAIRSIGFRLLQFVVSLIVPVLLLTAMYAGWIGALTNDSWPIWFAATALAVYLYALGLGGIQNLTPYGMYRSRLSRCFDVMRQERVSPIDPQTVESRARQRVITPRMSSLRELTDMPELLICATGSITEQGVTATGSYAQQVVFSPKSVYLPGVDGAEIAMDEMEAALNPEQWTGMTQRFNGSVMSCVAITGAAMSPSMGKFTKTWLRAVMTILNLRLGCWIPNPASESGRAAVRKYAEKKNMVLRPGASLVYYFREMRGRHYLRDKYLFVSDGGHLENLGIVELLRQGCTEIWCVDASGDQPGSQLTLSESLTIASGELGLEIEFNVNDMALDEEQSTLNTPVVKSVHAKGIARNGAFVATIYVVKVGVDTHTSSRILEMRRRYKRFPYDSTLNQLYTAERFDLYRDLGFESMSRALAAYLPCPNAEA